MLEHDVTYHLIYYIITYLPVNYYTPILPEYFLNSGYLLHI